jgi:mRNA-degrading endonuclease RelE of RelBE toxin-antitoxin system
MKVEFLSGFEKDLCQSKDKKLAKIVLDCIQLFESAQCLEDIPNVKKLKGNYNAYRYRKGKYRIGFFFEDNVIIFAAFASRDKIYHRFP